jgi:hypothetical protein
LSADLNDEYWRATVLRRSHDALVASVEQMRRALKLPQEADAILEQIKKTLHAQVREQRTFVWMETEWSGQATSEALTVLQLLYERPPATAFNKTDDEAPDYFEDAIQDFMIAHDGKTPTRKARKTARNAWRDDPAANRRIRKGESSSAGEGIRSHYLGRPEKYDSEVILAFANVIARAIGRPKISWTRGTGVPDYASRGVILDVLVAAVEWAMCVAWQYSGPPGSKPPKVMAEGILRHLKAKQPLTNSTD